jgi:metal-dependent HD superfamily phosphatase/phosphodiesterase
MVHPSEAFFHRTATDEKMRVHCAAVIDCCIGACTGTTLNNEVFVIAGWIHDLGKLTGKANHHNTSLLFLDEFLAEAPQYEHLRPEITDCILHHRTQGTPTTLYGELFKVADKVALESEAWTPYRKR